MEFDVDGALAAGWTKAEIADYLAQRHGSFDIAGARKHYDDDQIITHLTTPVAEKVEEAPRQAIGEGIDDPYLTGQLGAAGGAGILTAEGIIRNTLKAPGKVADVAKGAMDAIRARKQQQAPTESAAAMGPRPAGSPVENWTRSQHQGEYYGGSDYEKAHEKAMEAKSVPERFPGYAVPEGGAQFALPQSELNRIANEAATPPLTPKPSVSQRLGTSALGGLKAIPTMAGHGAAAVGASLPARMGVSAMDWQEAENRRAADQNVRAGVGYTGAVAPWAAMLSKSPKTRALVTGASALIPGVNAMFGKAAGGSIKPVTAKMTGSPDLLMQGIKASNFVKQPVQKFGWGGVVEQYALPYLSKAVKSGKQLAREAEYVHDIAPTHQFSIPKQISIQDLQGKTLVGVPGDRTLTGHEVRAVNRVPLSSPVEQQGGPMYGLRQQDLGEQNFWASKAKAAVPFQNKASRAQQQHGADVFGLYTAMAPDAGNFALHTTETLLNQIPAMNPSKKEIAAFNKMIQQQFPQFAGITDPDVLAQLAKDSDMRKYLAERMNKPTVAAQYGMPSGEATIHAITEPALRDVPTGNTGFAVGKLHPEKELNPGAGTSHSTYDTNIPGEFQGQMIAQLPWQMYFPEAAKQIASSPKHAPHAWGTFKMGDYNQPVTQELVDRIAPIEEAIQAGKQNMATGGEVKHMAGGKLAQAGGLSMLPEKQVEDMTQTERKYNYLTNRPAYQKAEMLGEAVSGVPEFLASFHPGYGVGRAIGAIGDAALNTGDYKGAMLDTALNAPGILSPIGKVVRAGAPAIRGALPFVGGLGMLGASEAAEAGPTSPMKGIINNVMEGFAPKVAKKIEAGAPHTYGPQATGDWIRDYQPAARPQPQAGWRFPVLDPSSPEAAAMADPYLVKHGSTYTVNNLPQPSQQKIDQYGLKNAMATQRHPALQEAQDRTLRDMLDQKRMQYLRSVADPNTPGETLQDLMQQYPRWEDWMR